MGVDIRCKKTGKSMTLSYSGFARWQMKIAELYNHPWRIHYAQLFTPPLCKSEEFCKKFDAETRRLMEAEHLDPKIIDFCLQSDTGGSITYGACKNILKAIGDYTDNTAYTYTTLADHDWDRLKDILKDCVETKSKLIWD